MPKDLKKHHRRLICSLGLCRTSATCTFLTTRFLYEYYIIKLCWIITMHGVLWMRYLCFSNSISNQTGGGQISLQIKLISFFSWLLNLYCNWISLADIGIYVAVHLFWIRYFFEDPGAVCPCICHTVPGHLCNLHIAVQHCDETNLSWYLLLYRVVHEIPQGCEKIIWQGPWYFPTLFPGLAVLCPGPADQ